jgi:putative Mg2+ transporter-C (MgtC) family protein
LFELTEITFRIVLSVGLCGLIGLERGRRHKGAGLRTHILVGVGSALVVLTSLSIFETYKDVTTVDPTRMITGIVTGIGFLCAGTIIRGSSSVKGLTTAATLWISSCLGIAIGAGHYSSAIIVTIVVFFVLIGIDTLKNKVIRKKPKNISS